MMRSIQPHVFVCALVIGAVPACFCTSLSDDAEPPSSSGQANSTRSPTPDQSTPDTTLTAEHAAARCGALLECAPHDTLEALCTALVKLYVEQDKFPTLEDDPDMGTPECKPIASRNVDTGALKAMALLELATPDGGQELYTHFVIKTDAGWLPAAPIAYVYNPGMGGISAEGKATFALKNAIPGGAMEMIIDSTLNHSDSDLGIAEMEESTQVERFICELITVNGLPPAPVCTAPILLSYTRERQFMPEVAEGTDIQPNPDLPDIQRYKANVRFHPPGHITLVTDEIAGLSEEDLTNTSRLKDGAHPLRKRPLIKGLP